MCEFCVKHGEGKKWYLNAKNYSDDLLSDIRRRKFTKDIVNWLDDTYRNKLWLLKKIPVRTPLIGSIFRNIIKGWLLPKHWGQVIPMEDIEKIFDLTNSITRIPCACRMIATRKEVRVCFLLSLDPSKIGPADIIDQSFFGGPDIAKFEKVTKIQALQMMRENESNGMVHTVWTLGTPYIGAICNCDISEGCIAMNVSKEIMPVIFKAEYVAVVKEDDCSGCKECVKICQFGAIAFESHTKKAYIDTKKCYGCGICKVVCQLEAISLVNRETIPGACNSW